MSSEPQSKNVVVVPGERDRISLTVVRHEPSADFTYLENGDDMYVLASPLRRSDTRIESEGRLIHDGEVRPGMLRVLVPGQRDRVKRRASTELMMLSMPGAMFRQLTAGQADGSSISNALLRPHHQVVHLCRAVIWSLELDPNHRQLCIDGLTQSLLGIFLNSLSNRDKLPRGARRFGLSEAELARCFDYAESRLDGQLDLDAWAAELSMQTPEFARRFQQAVHIAPYAWFMNWRIDRAKTMLCQSKRPVVDIAMELGFSSQSHFTEAFSRRVGQSPGRWRAHRIGSMRD